METHQYADANQMGCISKCLSWRCAPANVRKLETYRFAQSDGVALTGGQAQVGDSIAMQALGRRGWQPERIGSADSFSVALVDGDALVLHTQLKKTARWRLRCSATMTATVCGSATPAAAARASLSRRQARLIWWAGRRRAVLSAADALIG